MTQKRRSPQNPSGYEESILGIEAFCLDLMEGMGLNLSVECREEVEIAHINLTGPDRPLLLSSSALLLNSIEYLLNRIFRGGRDDAPGILLDSENYREHRELELKLLAQMALEKVLALGKPLSLQPMVPRERRIVHLALAEIEGVRSQSDGEGENRSITIYPS